jgi:hypothetical protein
MSTVDLNETYIAQKKEYTEQYEALGRPVGYSVADMQAYLMPRRTNTGKQILDPVQSNMAGATQFATLTMISISTHRDKFPVSSLSKIQPTGYTAGHRTIAGTMTFSTFDRAVFTGLLTGDPINNRSYKNVHSDEIPLFDMMILLSDDTGNVSMIKLQGITILDDSMVLSLDNISPNETYSYMAMDLEPLTRKDSGYNNTSLSVDAEPEVVQQPSTFLWPNYGSSSSSDSLLNDALRPDTLKDEVVSKTNPVDIGNYNGPFVNYTSIYTPTGLPVVSTKYGAVSDSEFLARVKESRNKGNMDVEQLALAYSLRRYSNPTKRNIEAARLQRLAGAINRSDR